MKFSKFFEYYLGDLPTPSEDGEIRVSALTRNDSSPSLCINLQTGNYKDFGDEDFCGDIISWIMLFHEVSFKLANAILKKYLKSDTLPPSISYEDVCEYQSNLKQEHYSYLLEERLLSEQTIKHHNIGWDMHTQRYIIPIFTKMGLCVNLRKYSPNKIPKMLNVKGCGSARLYPLNLFQKDSITYLCEGEWDALLLRTFGLNSISNTGGAGTWKSEWHDLLSDTVYICYDMDKAGQTNAEKVALRLLKSGKDVKIIQLPEAGMDITDFFTEDHTIEEFNVLISKARFVKLEDLEVDDTSQTDVKMVNDLYSATQIENHEDIISYPARVVGKDESPYIVPKEVEYTCEQNEEDRPEYCNKCPNNTAEVSSKVFKSDEFLEFIRIPNTTKVQRIYQMGGIPRKCRRCSFKVIKYTNVEELLLAPEVGDFFSKYMIQLAFYANEDRVSANKSYQFTGKLCAEPWNQKTTFVLEKAKALQDDIRSFKMSSKLFDSLKVFQKGELSVKEKFDDIHEEFEKITAIIGRRDLLTGIDLTYHSVLDLKFQGYKVQKPWLEMLVIGDTRTGKSETVAKMLEYFKLGEMSTAENTSFSGLVGGMQQNDRRWMITWGKIPLNDTRIFIIDEASGLSTDEISKMSDIRSRGVAEIVKIHTERTYARTRLIWISNPRYGGLSNETYGVLTVPSLIGQPEDIARFDFAIATSKDDISLEEINAARVKDSFCNLKYSAKLCSKLILWAWSRTSKNIQIDKDAEQLLLKYAVEQGNFYSAEIPLVEGANQRFKLLKIAVAAACRLFSTKTGEEVIVTSEHVEFAKDFLDEIYSKRSFDYAGYSKTKLKAKRVAADKVEDVKKILNIDVLPIFASSVITYSSLEATKVIEPNLLAELFRMLVINHMLIENKAKPGFYHKSPRFIQILKEIEVEYDDQQSKEQSK
jgi:hypothetical protein